MPDEIEAKERAHEMREGESGPAAEQPRLGAERKATAAAEYAALSWWAAPVSGTHAEKRNEAAKIAVRETGAAARARAAERQEQPLTLALRDT